MAKNNHWIQKVADQVEQYTAKKKEREAEIVCASGISPSGVIHLGNLREIITVHLVTEELIQRGKKAVHIHFWDDYDRFRKVPADVPQDFEKYIGMPLSDIPDPFGMHDSYSAHFIEECKNSLEKIGINPRYIRQSEVYRQSSYSQLVKESLENRFHIFDILNLHQTEDQQKNKDQLRDSYYPFKVYCENCMKDNTDIIGYDSTISLISYCCRFCGNKASYKIDDKIQGKLVWKVDWPMRWKYYQVDFEPGGLDHSTPGSSYTVGKQIIKDIFNDLPPLYVGYAFVGITGGAQKISSSAGTNATPSNALSILEPAMLRWLYIRTDIRSSFNINFDDQVFRIYDEWDRLKQRIHEGKSDEQESFIFHMCTHVNTGKISHSEFSVPFRLIASTYEITKGNRDEIFRILSQHIESTLSKEELLSKIELRLKCAANWVANFLPENERIIVKNSFDKNLFTSFDGRIREGISILAKEFESHWSLSGLTTLLYDIPKRQLGFPLDVKPTAELKQVQHEFFNALYQLLLGKETGPRLPTLFLSIGAERLSALLTPQDSTAT